MKVQTQKKMDVSQESRLVLVCVDQSGSTLYVVGLDSAGETIMRRTFRLKSFSDWLSRPDLPRLTVAMRACGQREWLKDICWLLGHTPIAIPPSSLTCDSHSSKNKYFEAESIKRASSHLRKSSAPFRSSNAVDLAMLIAVRHVMLEERTALTSRIRVFLLERGLAVPVGEARFTRSLSAILEDDSNTLTPILRMLIRTLQGEIGHLSDVIKGIEVMMGTAERTARAGEQNRRISDGKRMGEESLCELQKEGNSVCGGGDMAAFLGLMHGISGLVPNTSCKT